MDGDTQAQQKGIPTAGGASDSSATEAPPRHGAQRHEAAVARTLANADEAAASGDLDMALSWLSLIEAIGDRLPDRYERKRRSWLAEVTGDASR